jgi:hypothetical protein
MFSKRKALSGRHWWDRAFIVKLGSDLSSAGFSNVVVKLPHNLVGMENSKIPIQEFLDRDRNYPSVIFVAKNGSTNETIKILFVNISRKAFFLDDTFPSGHSEPPQLFVQSPDPARAYSLFNFFYEYLRQDTSSSWFFLWLLGVLSLLFIAAEFLSFIATRRTLFQSSVQFGLLIDVISIIIALILQYRYFTAPKGLFVKEQKTAAIGNYVNMAIKGELRDNPVVNIVISVVTAIVTAAILKWLGLL